ncbi:hypothetical protein [Natranaerofaba carboxydovora]|uniref:hypothetical protein n=1 Tax=Natranaerofaba carboxydovora TaxID=2742683 RepID=UPI001F142823|nr:hypothetical protein [Natranaerofaba carboxydovora]UMZ74711.1 hypothetical protein ACONDI_02311 [Natranaerofaba carboxydovora]
MIYKDWEFFCKKLNEFDINTYKVKDAFEDNIKEPFAIIRHDLEGKISRALDIARIESNNNITSTYYVHGELLTPANVELLREIEDLGHEVGYHYDVLDKHNGDREKAIEEFKYYIDKFVDLGFDLKSICPHGNPLKKRNGWRGNKDLFVPGESKRLFGLYDATVDIPSQVGKERYTFISDAAYSWNRGNFSDIKDIVDFIKDNNSIYIYTHTHRWQKSRLKFYVSKYLFRSARFTATTVYNNSVGKDLVNKFYYLAKRL